MKSLIIYALLFIASVNLCYAQTIMDNSEELTEEKRYKNVYLEIGGTGIIGSVNFDMRFNKNRHDGLGFRVGLGGIPYYEENPRARKRSLIFVPIGINNLIGNGKHSLVMESGIMPNYSYEEGYRSNRSEFSLFGYFNTGYRFQSTNNGFMFQISWTPVIELTEFPGSNAGLWFGICLGYHFK